MEPMEASASPSRSQPAPQKPSAPQQLHVCSLAELKREVAQLVAQRLCHSALILVRPLAARRARLRVQAFVGHAL